MRLARELQTITGGSWVRSVAYVMLSGTYTAQVSLDALRGVEERGRDLGHRASKDKTAGH